MSTTMPAASTRPPRFPIAPYQRQSWSPWEGKNFQVSRTAEEPDRVTARIDLVVTWAIRDLFRVETLSSSVQRKRDFSNASTVLSV